jgi:hypothetical protein
MVVSQVLNFLSKLIQTPVLFVLLIGLALLGLFVMSRTELELLVAVLAIAVPSLTFILGSAPARMLYFFPVMAGLCAYRGLGRIVEKAEARLVTADVPANSRWAPIDRLDASLRSLTALDRQTLFRFGVLVVLAFVIGSNLATYLTIAGGAHQYYLTLDEDQEDALDWIGENVPEEAVVAPSQKSFGWNVEGYTRRNAFEPQGQKSYMKQYVFPEQRRQARVQDRVFSRHLSVENGNVRFAHTAPHDGPGNPAIGLDTGNYRTYAEFLDNETTVTLSRGGETVTRPLSTAQTTVHLDGSDEARHLTTTYRWDDLTLNQTVSLERGTATVSIRYAVVRSVGTVEDLSATLRYPTKFQPRSVEARDGALAVTQRNRFGMPVSMTATTSGTTTSVDQPTDLSRERTVFHFKDVSPATVTLQYEMNRELRATPVSVYRTPAVLAANDIEYVVWSQPPNRLESDYDRETKVWLYESPYYQPVYEADDIVVFRVTPTADATGSRVSEDRSNASLAATDSLRGG